MSGVEPVDGEIWLLQNPLVSQRVIARRVNNEWHHAAEGHQLASPSWEPVERVGYTSALPEPDEDDPQHLHFAASICWAQSDLRTRYGTAETISGHAVLTDGERAAILLREHAHQLQADRDKAQLIGEVADLIAKATAVGANPHGIAKAMAECGYLTEPPATDVGS